MLPRPQTVTTPSPEARTRLLQAAKFAQMQDYDRAEAAYLSVLELAPDWDIARFQLGLLQLTSARPAVAAATWQRLDQLDANHPLKLFKLGFEHLARNEFEAAIAAFDQGIARNTENAPLNKDMAMVIERILQAAPQAEPNEESRERDAAALPTDHILVSTYRNLN